MPDDARSPQDIASQSAPLPVRPRRRLRLTLLLLGPLLVAIGAAAFYFSGGRYVSTDNAYVKADVVMVGAQVSGQIASVAVRENDFVRQGQTLFAVDDRPFRIALAEAEAGLKNARRQVESLKAQYAEKQQELALARTDAAYADREYARQTDLLERHVASRAKFDEAERAAKIARQKVALLERELLTVAADLGGNPAAPVESHPLFLTAAANRDRAALDLQRATITAPFDGVIGATPKVGDYVAPGQPVTALVASSGLWVEANFKETELTHLRTGMPARLSIDTYPDRTLKGVVESISPASGAEFSVLPPQNATGNWVKIVQRIPVRIAIQGDDGVRLRAGMSVSVDVDTGRESRLAALFGGLFGGQPAAAAQPQAAEPTR
jgi:membrane fusion protein (multidrug efflux system)